MLIYISDKDKRTLQVVLRNIIVTGTKELDIDASSSSVNNEPQISSEGLKAASIYVATIPILCVYPFLQRYFVKGIMVGSLKG